MKKVIAMIVVAVSCLLQQGCYMFVDRENKYYASTEYLWNGGKSFKTAGDAMMLTGIVIPVVGWVTLIPAGAVATLAERCVVAPAFDTVKLPIDFLDNMLLQIDETNYQDVRRRLESDLDATLADSEYWESRACDKLYYLNRWLSEKSDLKNLSDKQVSAILSILRSWLKGQSDIDWRTMYQFQGIVGSVYEKSCERESLDMLAKGLVEIKEATKVPMFQVIPHKIEYSISSASEGKDNVKFSDEQLMVLLDADIMRAEIDRLLKMRQEKREKEVNGQGTN